MCVCVQRERERASTHRCDGERVERVHAPRPRDGAAVLLCDLVVEAVHPRDVARLVVPPQQRELGGIAHLQQQQIRQCLDAERTTVDIVPLQRVEEEEEVGDDDEVSDEQMNE